MWLRLCIISELLESVSHMFLPCIASACIDTPRICATEAQPSFISVFFTHFLMLPYLLLLDWDFLCLLVVGFYFPELKESLIQVLVVGCKLLKIKHFCIPYVVQFSNTH